MATRPPRRWGSLHATCSTPSTRSPSRRSSGSSRCGAAWQGELIQHTKGGRRLIVESRWAAQYDEQRALVALLEVNRDITARLRPQMALLEMAPDATGRHRPRTA